jgi:Glycosyl transferase family 2
MPSGPRHEVADLKIAPGELSFEARVGDRAQRVWMRTETPLLPTADAALAACLLPAMRSGGTLELTDPISPRMLRTQREFQAIQRAWSLDWEFGDPSLEEVEVIAPTRTPDPLAEPGRVAAFFSGGVDSWSTVLANPDVTDLIFVRGTDILPRLAHQEGLADEVEARLREAATELGLPLHVVETNIRELSDPLVRWETYFPSAMVAVAHFLSPRFERILMASGADHETQTPVGSGRMVDQLWSSERLEIVDDGGRFSREDRLRKICQHPVVQRTLRVCWHNTGGAYNCGRCRKCVLTMLSLEALGVRRQVATFPPELDLSLLPSFEFNQRILMPAWEDALDTIRAARRADLEGAVEDLVARGRRNLGLPANHRSRSRPGPPPTVRIAVVVPAWRQARYLAAAVGSALDQEISCGVGVVVVNDGCPDPETERIGLALRDANPERVAYLTQGNGGLSAARNAGIRAAFARWPQLEAVFPLDADNMLSPQTLALLREVLEEHPEAAWATPALEFFGGEGGEWNPPGPFLTYRQLFENQCDAGSLVRREVFAAGISYDETMRNGFEDWELFLRASLTGHRGVLAGRCGFRYRRRPDSMVTTALQWAERLEAEIRRRHEPAYAPAALARLEHAEAPRFALVRCDRADVLLTANCELEPRRLGLAEFARSLAAASGPDPSPGDHVPAVTVLTTTATIERLDAAAELAGALFGLQSGLRGRDAVGLRVGGDSGASPAALAIRACALHRLSAAEPPRPETLVEADPGGAAGEPIPEAGLRRAAALIGAAVQSEGMPLSPISNPSFFERLHLDEGRTTFPGAEPVSA